MGSNVEAKAMCIRRIEDMVAEPVYTIFHVQRGQIASRTETDNATLYHFKNSLAKVSEWNASTVKEFCSSLPVRFPVLNGFEQLFLETQEFICKILCESSESSTYTPIVVDVHESLHEILSECSKVFVSYPQWFAVKENSTEYTTCQTNAKTKVHQMNVVENVIMKFIKSEINEDKDNMSESDKSESENSGSGSDSDESVSSDKDGKATDEEMDEVDVVKVIDINNGDVEEKSSIGEFSTPGGNPEDNKESGSGESGSGESGSDESGSGESGSGESGSGESG